MNLSFFGLRKTPFGDVDSSSLFWTAKRRELASQFRHALVDREGILVLTGEEGSGKTVFVQAVLEGLAARKLKVISVSSEKLSFPTLLKTVIRELSGTVEQQRPLSNPLTKTAEKPPHPTAVLEEIAPLMRTLHAALLAHHAQQGGTVVLVIDNAHYLPVNAIKDFYWLSLLGASEGKLLQTIFVGNATLSLKLEMPQLQVLKQHTAVHGELIPLSFEESFVYLLARLNEKSVRRSSSPIFSVEALRLLARHGKGNLRFLNTLANAALRAGATRRQKPISGPLLLEIIGEFRTLPMMNRPGARIQLTRPPIPARRAATLPNARQLWAAGMGAAAAALVLFFYQYGTANGWNTMFPDFTRSFRNSMVPQAASGTATAPISLSSPPAPSPTLDVIPSSRVTQRDPDEKERRKLTKTRGKTKDHATAPTPPAKLKGKRPTRSQHRSSGGDSPSELRSDVTLPELSLPGKILYRIPRDPSSNKDRLFDK